MITPPAPGSPASAAPDPLPSRPAQSAQPASTSGRALRLVLAEDNLLVREGIRRLLEAQDGVEVVAVCGSLDTLLQAVETEQPDVVLTDIRMPPTGTDEGIRAAQRLRQSHPNVGVVVLSQYDDPAYALALLEHGAARRA